MAKACARGDKSDGPTAGTETVDPLEFLARLTAHIPNKRQVMTRYYGYYANSVRGARRRHAETGPVLPVPTPVAEPVPLPLREARRHWAELLRQIFNDGVTITAPAPAPADRSCRS